MKMSFRWYGDDDPVSLEQIRQISGVEGIVSAIYDIPAGESWPLENILQLKEKIEKSGLFFVAIESVPVHEDIKLGLASRDKLIDNYRQTLENLGKAGLQVVCYNFMPVFDWTRSQLDFQLDDGSTALIYREEDVSRMDPLKGDLDLPGWDKSYESEQLKELLQMYQDISQEQLWSNLKYFLQGIIPVAEKYDIKMAIHPDDPPWSIFNLPRIITCKKNLERLVNLVKSPANGLALCSGSLGADPVNDIPDIIKTFAEKIHFAHVRNVEITGKKGFAETAHRSCEGSLDMYQIMKAYHEIDFKGPLRPDHGRMIWDETGRPGYGLFDRALGASYLLGIWEAIDKCDCSELS